MTSWNLINIHELFETVWKEGQNCSNSNRYISGTNWNFREQYDPWNNAVKAVMKKQKYKSLSFEL